ncbi:hypothetical protein SAMN04489745_3481 [Arthrobacter woluwensis]|uniref:Uncharacterized protein n=1 Tax=Arthrobacter woluwensis TaxID=156980 RepID=A0A1H4TDE2_9MICC|nr:hypothetical protein SAMN04489745_3140 [Arthrobacter woluwensis]SEC90729.1 hypothetical protein SAMN04489745_3481 [Arthrobacter woluwensis]
MPPCDQCRVARSIMRLDTPAGPLYLCWHHSKDTDGLTLQDGWAKAYDTDAIKELR